MRKPVESKPSAVLARAVQVTLGGQSYTVHQRPIRAARAWREKLGGHLGQVVSVLQNVDGIDLTRATDLGQLAGVLRDVVIQAPDIACDLLCEYSPEIAADRERIEGAAYDDEVMAASIEVLKLAYPFGGLLKLVGGRAALPTSKS
jgi:hypothetical protein